MANAALDSAINVLQAEIDACKQGTPDQPPEDSPEWFRLRALACGLSLLKQMRQVEATSPAAAESFYRGASKALKASTMELLDASA